MLTVRKRAEGRPKADVDLKLTFEFRQKSRLLTRAESGEEVALMLDRGSLLRGGDLLAADDGRIVAIVAAPEALMAARCVDAQALARCAYHLGNRHTQVALGKEVLHFAADEVLANMLRGLGASVEAVQAPFEPEGGAYAAGHHSHSSDAKHSGIIHDMMTRVLPR